MKTNSEKGYVRDIAWWMQEFAPLYAFFSSRGGGVLKFMIFYERKWNGMDGERLSEKWERARVWENNHLGLSD